MNPALGMAREGSPPAVVVRKVQEAELDEMWSCVGGKKHPRWLWGALDHQMGRILAYVFGRREDQAFLKLKALLEQFAFAAFTRTAGVRSAGTWIHTAMWSVSGGHNSWSGSISRCARGSNA